MPLIGGSLCYKLFFPQATGDAMLRAVFVGVVLAAIGLTSSPTEMIIIAQAANAVILPIIAILLTIVVNDKKLMGENRNGVVANILAIIVIGVTLFISARNLYKLFF